MEINNLLQAIDSSIPGTLDEIKEEEFMLK